jgi:hypothetical protein
MTAPAIWPLGKNETRTAHDTDQADEAPAGQAPSDPEPAHLVIGEMADLLDDTRSAAVTDTDVLGVIAIGFAVESGSPPRRCGPTWSAPSTSSCSAGSRRAGWPPCSCWSGTGAPVDLKPHWVTLPPVGADPEDWSWHRAYLLLGAARQARFRMQFADT